MTSKKYEAYIRYRFYQGESLMTRNQAEFAEWLFQDKQAARIEQIGDLQIIFNSVYEWLKYKSKMEKYKNI